MASQTRKIIIVAVVACAVLFAIGILIGHFAIDKRGDKNDERADEQRGTKCGSTEYNDPWTTYKNDFIDHADAQSCYQHSCHSEDLPRTYLAYHLNGKTIDIDGRLNDLAWGEVPWSDSFVDIRGPDYPKPYFDTKFKVRWDDERLYVGAYMLENDFWGTLTEDESLVWTENAFEVYAVPDGSMHNYKEMQISVRNVTWDLMLKKAYIDRPACTDAQSVVVSNWTSHMQKSTYTDGVVNDVNGKGTYWSAEWSFRFDALAEFTDRPVGQPTPEAEEAWFFIFARPEYKFKIENGQYVKDTNATTEWWSWQPMYTINLHLPSRFGLVQFKRDIDDRDFFYPRWHIYRALFEVFEAEHRYKSVNGMFISELQKLDVAPKIMSTKCVDVSVELTESDTDFQANVRSRRIGNLPVGHIRADRYVWFTS